MDKRGELTSTEITIWILAIVGFGIVLAALFLINLGGYSSEDICKLSVLSRGTAPAGGGYIPLKCVAEKICIREGFSGGCEDEFAGEKDVEYIRLSGNDGVKADKIEEITANAMYDCWTMMGEGKVDLFSGGLAQKLGFSPADSSCVVCSRVVVDKEVNEFVIKLIDVKEYMQSHQIPGQSLTYLQKFTDRGVSSYAKVDESALGEVESYEGTIEKDSSGNQLAIVFMQIRSEKWGEAMENLGITAIAAGGFASQIPIVGKTFVRLLFTTKGLVAAAVAGGVAAGVTYVNTAAGQANAAGYCGEFTTSDEKAAEGCSVMQAIGYNFNDINNICSAIEGEL